MHRPSLATPLLLTIALAACGPTAAPPAATPPPPLSPAAPAVGLDRVMGQPAAALATLFGAPALDVREGRARKLQYRSPACVLDTYLYPRDGGDEPKVTWIDTRTPTGADFDRASCIASLVRTTGPAAPPGKSVAPRRTDRRKR